MKQEIGTTELTWVGQSDGSGTDPNRLVGGGALRKPGPVTVATGSTIGSANPLCFATPVQPNPPQHR